VTEPGSVLLDRAQIERAFTALGDRLVQRGVVADVFIVGGAAMALAYDATRVTRDVDSLFVPHGVVLEEARNVAQTSGCRRGGSTSRPASTFQARTTQISAACSTILASG
jgi:predicted nucleotidyltransferase